MPLLVADRQVCRNKRRDRKVKKHQVRKPPPHVQVVFVRQKANPFLHLRLVNPLPLRVSHAQRRRRRHAKQGRQTLPPNAITRRLRKHKLDTVKQ